MDANTFFTFAIPGAMIGSIAWNYVKKNRAWRAEQRALEQDEQDEVVDQPVKRERGKAAEMISQMLKQPLAAMSANSASASAPVSLAAAKVKGAASSGDVVSLAQVLTHLNDRRDEVPHWMCIGGTGAGKSTFCRLVLAYRVARGEQFVILAGKRTAVFADIPSVGRDAIGSDGALKFDRVRAVSRAILAEVVRRDNTEFDDRQFKVLNIVVDDASILMSEIDEVVQMCRIVGLLGREIDMRLIILTGSLLVKELGFEGRGDLRDHFAIVTYRKRLDGTRETLLRPRYDEKDDSAFDASSVPELAAVAAIDPSLAWGGLGASVASDVVFTPPPGAFVGVSMGSNNSNNNASNNNDIKLSRYNNVLRRLMDGESQHKIAAEVGVSLATVNGIAQAMTTSSNTEV